MLIHNHRPGMLPRCWWLELKRAKEKKDLCVFSALVATHAHTHMYHNDTTHIRVKFFVVAAWQRKFSMRMF